MLMACKTAVCLVPHGGVVITSIRIHSTSPWVTNRPVVNLTVFLGTCHNGANVIVMHIICIFHRVFLYYECHKLIPCHDVGCFLAFI